MSQNMFLVLLFLSNQLASAVQIHNQRTEYLINPLGLDAVRPRFSYELLTSNGDLRGLEQKSYRIEVYQMEVSETEPIWTSLNVSSSNTHNIQYGVGGAPSPSAPLKSGTMYKWTVQTTTTGGVSQVSASATFSMGILKDGNTSGWTGKFIGMASSDPDQAIAPWFRKTFDIPSKDTNDDATSSSSFLYVASIGFCEVTVNGKQVTDSVLSPSISYLPSRVLYRTYDVGALLLEGEKNTIGLWASAGWANYTSFDWATGVQWVKAPIVMAELQMKQKVIVHTDSTWECRPSTTSRLNGWGNNDGDGDGFGGDLIDSRINSVGWDHPPSSHPSSHSSSHAKTPLTWKKATTYPINTNMTISSDVMERTVKHSNVSASSIHVKADGNVTITMSELFSGWFEIKNLIAEPNKTIYFYVSTTQNVLSEHYMIDGYIMNESGIGNFRMRFSYHEIHYITVVGLQTPPSQDDIVGYRLSINLDYHGKFTSSNSLMNSIYDTTVNNYLGLTTGGQTVDCPHRERRGYGGDAHTSYQFALQNFNVGSYFTKWSRDFSDVQLPSGDVPHTAPTVSGGGGPAWSGFVVTLPWEVYRTYNDTSLLEIMYPTMIKQLAFYKTKTHSSDGLLHSWDPSKWYFLGDWITPHGSEDDPTAPINILFNNCYLHYILILTANIGDILGHKVDATKYRSQASVLASNINRAYYNNDTHSYIDNLQTHLLMPLATGVVSKENVDSVILNLEKAISKNGGHLDTGLTGNYFMTKYFTEIGRNDLMMGITNKTTFPSYGYFLAQGYTTWPEQWNVDTCCDQVKLSKMHGCYNAIGLWFIQGLVGINVDYSNHDGYPIVVRGGVDSDVKQLSWVQGERGTPNGVVSSSWLIHMNAFYHNITVPGNGHAKIYIPSTNVSNVMENNQKLSKDIDIMGMEIINKISYVVLGVGAGKYTFSSTWVYESVSSSTFVGI
jgi:alpha-L-rhamnosidase